MSSGYLALNNRGATPTIVRYVNATQTQVVGPALPASAQEDFGPNFNPGGARTTTRVVQFRGDDDLFVMCKGQVYRYDGAAWNSVYTMVAYVDSAQLAGSDSHGPHLVYVNSVPTLVVIWKHSSGFTQWNSSQSTDGTTWTPTASFQSSSIQPYGCYRAHVVNGIIYWFIATGSNQSRLAFWNPTSQTGGEFNYPIAVRDSSCDATVLNGRHLIMGSATTAPFNARVFELNGGALAEVASLPGTEAWVAGTKQCLFTDGTDLFAIRVLSGPVWSCHRLTDNGLGGFNIADITGTVFTAGVQSLPNTSHWCALIDHEANPTATSPDIWLAQMGDGAPGSLINFYRWNGPAALIGNAGSPNDTGGDASACLPYMWNVSGSHFWTGGVPHAVIESATPTLGGEIISFRLYSASGVDAVQVDLLYSDIIGVRANQVGSLSNPSHGAISGGNLNTGLTADNGATLYSFKWGLIADGVGAGDRVERQLRVETP